MIAAAPEQELETGSTRESIGSPVVDRDESTLGPPVAMHHDDRNPDNRLEDISDSVVSLNVAGLEEEATNLIAARLKSRSKLPETHFIPVREYGIANGKAFLVENRDGLTNLEEIASKQGRFHLAIVSTVTAEVARSLALASRLGVRHGDLTASSVARDENGRYKLGGFPVVVPDKSTSDTVQLARFATSLALGRAWKAETIRESNFDIAVERLRGESAGINLQVAETLVKGIRSDFDPSFGSPLEFSQALSASIQAAAIDIAAGAWESISRRDLGMANLLTEMAETYDPDNSEVTLLKLRLQGDALRNPGITTGAIWDAAHHMPQPELERHLPPAEDFILPLDTIAVDAPFADPGGTPLTPEIEKLLAGPPPKPARQGKLNTWALFGIGVLLMVLVFLVISALTFTQMT